MTRTQLKTFESFADINAMCENPFMGVDLMRMLCGEKIGEGQFRAVYNYNLDNDLVIKLSTNPPSNQAEFNIWQSVKDMELGKWFAPCFQISPCGHFLLQKKTRRITDKDRLPTYLPAFFCDTKKTNFGFIGKQLVCFDYNLWSIESLFEKDKKAVWRP